MVLVLVGEYKSEKQQYSNAFVHTRVKSYLENGVDAKVFVINKRNKKSSYIYDGVDVITGNIEDCINYINDYSIDDICVHFINRVMIKALSGVSRKVNVYIFVHGNEALRWYERIFPYLFTDFITIRRFIEYIFNNTISIPIIKNFLKKSTHNITLITVSEWMKMMANKNWKCDNKEWIIIPNIIDDKLFIYNEKQPEQRYKLLLLRSFGSGKYANDISIKVIKKLSEYRDFERFQILIMGEAKAICKINKRFT